MTRIRYNQLDDGTLVSNKEFLANTEYVVVKISNHNEVSIETLLKNKVIISHHFKTYNAAIRGARKMLIDLGVNLHDEVRDGNNSLTISNELSTN